MPNINFDTGLVTYSVNGLVDVTFNPTDSNFVERLYASFEELDRKQEGYKAEVEKMADRKEIFTFTRKRDDEMREVIDNIFDAPVSDAVFGTVNVYALAQGLPIWANLILSVMDEIDTSFSREQKATNPRLKKYLEKYQKK